MFMVLMLLFTAVSMCYGWGMRGSLMGGEKGAMLPGAIIGMLFVVFTRSEVIMQNWYFFAAAGLMGMTFGGTEPYGETIGTAVEREKETYNRAKGYGGLMLKGALWFSIAGGYITMALSALTGEVYSAADIIIFCALIPLVQYLGVLVFNKPYNKEKGITPKIYFSWDSREEWGGNVALIAEMLVFAVIRKDTVTLIEMLFGLVFGAIGWALAIFFYDGIRNPNKKGKYLFNALSQKKIADSWKTMEFTLGAMGGVGLMLGFMVNGSRIKELVGTIEAAGGVHEFFPGAGNVFTVLIICSVAGMLIVNLISEVTNSPYSHMCDLFERPFYNVLPMALLMLGSASAAKVMTFFMLWLVAAIKCFFDRFKKLERPIVWQIAILLVTVAVAIGEVVRGYSFSETWALCGLPYMILEWIYQFSAKRRAMIKERHAQGKSIPQILGAAALWFPVNIILYHIIGFALTRI